MLTQQTTVRPGYAPDFVIDAAADILRHTCPQSPWRWRTRTIPGRAVGIAHIDHAPIAASGPSRAIGGRQATNRCITCSTRWMACRSRIWPATWAVVDMRPAEQPAAQTVPPADTSPRHWRTAWPRRCSQPDRLAPTLRFRLLTIRTDRVAPAAGISPARCSPDDAPTHPDRPQPKQAHRLRKRLNTRSGAARHGTMGRYPAGGVHHGIRTGSARRADRAHARPWSRHAGTAHAQHQGRAAGPPRIGRARHTHRLTVGRRRRHHVRPHLRGARVPGEEGVHHPHNRSERSPRHAGQHDRGGSGRRPTQLRGALLHRLLGVLPDGRGAHPSTRGPDERIRHYLSLCRPDGARPTQEQIDEAFGASAQGE